MKHPQLVILGFDEWLAKQLREDAASNGWILRDVRQATAFLAQAREPRPTVTLIQTDPHRPPADSLGVVAELHRLAPDAATVVVSDVKLPEDDRTAWTAAALDVGARYVLFPPLERTMLSELASSLMAAVIRRTMPEYAPNPARPPGVIDLAEEGQADA